MRVNTYLLAVSIKAGRTTVNLSPSFNKSTLSYTGVSPSTSSLTVTPTADDSANVTIYIGTTTVVSGSSTSVAVTAGQVNNLSIVVKANVNSAYAETYNFAITVSN
jgi:activator of HSP90 ATPase